MEKPLDVVVVGSCMMDLVCYAPRLPKEGETLRGSRFRFAFGGKGSNQCIAAKKLGGDCLLVAKIGNDNFGKDYLDRINRNRIPSEFVKFAEEVSTGIAQIIVAETGENQIVIVPGANELLSREDVKEAEEVISHCKVLICQLEVREEATIEALKIKAKSRTGKSILNAAPASKDLNPLLFTLPDVFCVNETEAEIITKTPVANLEQAKEAMDVLLSKGCKEVILTLGEGGSLYGKQKSKDYIHVPAPRVNAIDTTGAGDAFVGAMAFFIATRPELDMRDILQKASVVGAMSVELVGTQDSYPTMEEVAKRF